MSLRDQQPFPEVWDNSMLATLADCGQKTNLQYFHHLRPDSNNTDQHAGASFAKGVEWVRKIHYTPSRPAADPRVAGARALIQHYGAHDPGDNVKSAERMLGALESYLVQYNPDSDHVKPLILSGAPAVEFSFAWPIDVLHPTTKQPIILCGRFDMLGILNDDPNAIFVVDEKTTKQLGPTWPRQWQLKSQFMTYTWGARKFGHNVVGAIVRGVSILKTSYGHAEAVCYFPQWMIDRWYAQTLLRLERAKEMWEHNTWDFNFSTICSAYGGCQFRMLCESENPDQWASAPYYRVEKWNPLKLQVVEE